MRKLVGNIKKQYIVVFHHREAIGTVLASKNDPINLNVSVIGVQHEWHVGCLPYQILRMTGHFDKKSSL